MAICFQNMVVSPSLDGKFCLKCDVDLCFLSMITLFLNAFEKKEKKEKEKEKLMEEKDLLMFLICFLF